MNDQCSALELKQSADAGYQDFRDVFSECDPVVSGWVDNHERTVKAIFRDAFRRGVSHGLTIAHELASEA